MVNGMAKKDVVEADQWRLEPYKDINKAQIGANAMKANLFDFMREMLKTYNTNGNNEFTKLTGFEEERVAKAYKDLCKEKEMYASYEEFLQQMNFQDYELMQIAKEMKKLLGEYKGICEVLNWGLVGMMLKVSTVEDVELFLESARFWLGSSNLLLAISLGNLSRRAS